MIKSVESWLTFLLPINTCSDRPWQESTGMEVSWPSMINEKHTLALDGGILREGHGSVRVRRVSFFGEWELR
jgi:hypothetical protein